MVRDVHCPVYSLVSVQDKHIPVWKSPSVSASLLASSMLCLETSRSLCFCSITLGGTQWGLILPPYSQPTAVCREHAGAFRGHGGAGVCPWSLSSGICPGSEAHPVPPTFRAPKAVSPLSSSPAPNARAIPFSDSHWRLSSLCFSSNKDYIKLFRKVIWFIINVGFVKKNWYLFFLAFLITKYIYIYFRINWCTDGNIFSLCKRTTVVKLEI